MTGIMSVMLLFVVFGGAIWSLYLKEETGIARRSQNKNHIYIIGVMLIGFIAHIIAAASYYGYEADMRCFIRWSERIYGKGLAAFYTEGFHDYPPGYVYIMNILGRLIDLFNFDTSSELIKIGKTEVEVIGSEGLWVLIKMPAILADMAMGLLVYKFASKRFSSMVSAVFAALIIFNPTTVMNSSVWGQVDSILALFCLLTVYYSAEKKFIPAIASFAVGMLIKPQAFFVFPVLAFSLIDDIWFSPKFDVNKLIKHFMTGLCGVLAMFILFMPFGDNPIDGIVTIVNQYVETLKQYNYMTVNAFNIFAAAGNNWAAMTKASSVLGYMSMVMVAIYSAYVFFKSKSPAKHYICAFILFFGVYMFGVKQHERYAFPGIIMLLYALILMPKTKNYIMFGLFSLSQFFNAAWVLFGYKNTFEYVRSSLVTNASVLNIILFIICVHIIHSTCVRYDVQTPKTKEKQPALNKNSKKKQKNSNQSEGYVFARSEKKLKITKFDIIFVAAIMIVYSAIALHNLGNKFAPQSEIIVNNSGVVVDFGEVKDINKVEFYLGARQLNDSRNLNIDFLETRGAVSKTATYTNGDVFEWTSNNVNTKARYIKISTNNVVTKDDPTANLYLREICFLDAAGNQLEPVNMEDKSVAAIFDEQEMMAQGKDYMSGTLFDEIYHARTAYEFIHDMNVYEWTHPPLGKIFIGLGILVFGMVPFGWRIAGTVFGIMMVPVIYAFARRILKHKGLAAIACIVFTFDGMHFAQSRIGTIDTYVTFFIMLMYYYMYKYYEKSFYDTSLVKTLIPLGISGLCFGLGVACKWPALYAGAGLAIIFFYTLYRRYMEYRTAVKNPKGITNGIEHSYVKKVFVRNTVITLGFCVVMFVIVPLLTYALSFAPYWDTPSGTGFGTAFDQIERMWIYHSKTVANSTHPFSSHWYEWPVIYRPIYYFSNTIGKDLRQGISAFGNPAVWWLGIAAFAYMVARAIIIPLKKKDYFGKSKWIFGEIYTVFFLIMTLYALAGTNTNEKFERLFSCVLLYSSVMVIVFWVVLLLDGNFKQKSNSVELFLVIAYIIQLVPWMPIARTTYIYHYFPMVPFVVLMIIYSFKTIYDDTKYKQAVVGTAVAYAVIVVGLFILFYPVLSGATFNVKYGEEMLRWFDSWVLFPSNS